MSVRSQNGWPVLDAPATVVIHAGGRAWRVAKGLPAVVFGQFIERYAAEVEPITGGQLDDWSWAVRTVRGSTTVVSNHASGTAIDINALDHVRGARHTFTATQTQALDRLLGDFPVIRWGGAFGTVVDEMHFEICASLADLARWVTSHPLAEVVVAGGITYHPNLEVDVPLTPADLDAIADRIWNRSAVAVLHPESGQEQTIPMGTALGRAASAIANGVHSGVLHSPEGLVDALWNGATVRVLHPQTSEPQQITMAMAIGRAASVIANGVERKVLWDPEDYLSQQVRVVAAADDDGPGEHSTEAPGAPDWETPLREMHQLLEVVAATLTDPVAPALAALPSSPPALASGTSDGLPDSVRLAPLELVRQTHARAVQTTALVTGMSKAISILATANAKGRAVDALDLHNAVVDAITTSVPGVLTTPPPGTTDSPSSAASTETPA